MRRSCEEGHVADDQDNSFEATSTREALAKSERAEKLATNLIQPIKVGAAAHEDVQPTFVCVCRRLEAYATLF